MAPLLDLNGQKWKPVRTGEMTVFLRPNPKRPDLTRFCLHWVCAPPWVTVNDALEPHRTLFVEVNGELRGLRDWKQFAGAVAEDHPLIRDAEGVVSNTWTFAPEIRLWSAGPGGQHTHAKEGWDARVTFGAWEGENNELEAEVECFFPKEAAREVYYQWWLRQLRGEGEPEEEADLCVPENGWRFRFTGRLAFSTVSVAVPLNVAEPVEWARQLARQRLAMEEFGNGQVSGGHEHNETFKPADGVCGDNRLVILSPPSPRWIETRTRFPEWFRKPPKPE